VFLSQSTVLELKSEHEVSGGSIAHSRVTSESVCRSACAVLIADECPTLRRGLSLLISLQNENTICTEASTWPEVHALASTVKPQLAIIGFPIQRPGDLDQVRAVHRFSPLTRLLLFAKAPLGGSVLDPEAAGVDLAVSKSESCESVLRAISELRNGRTNFRAEQSLTSKLSVEHTAVLSDRLHEPITAREKEILKLLVNGHSNKQVASELGLSRRTIEAHRNHLMRKLHCSSFSALMRFAFQEGL
jgi:DNA-binding NarL/FixJ family response regulator